MRRLAWAVLTVGAMTACTAGPPVRSMALVGGDVTVTTPAGYCVDGSASKPRAGFAVIAPCSTLGTGDAAPAVLGLATVQVGPADSGSVAGAEPAWRDLLNSDSGAALLSAVGRSDTVTVLGSQVQANAVKVHFADTAPPPMAGLQADEWRAFLDMNGRLVTVAVRGPARAPLQDGTGAWLLDSVLKGLRAVAAEVPGGTPASQG